MAKKKKKISKINTVFFAAAALCLCCFIALSVVRHNYRSYEGTYVKRYIRYEETDYGEPEGTYRLERKQIVNVSESDGGYEIEYIVSEDADIIRDDSEKSLLFEGDDTYNEYHGFITEGMAKEGCIVKCVEKVSGETGYVGFYFTQNGICVLDNVQLVSKNSLDIISSSIIAENTETEYDNGYSLQDMFSVPQEERKCWLSGGRASVCEKRGYNVCAVLNLTGNIAAAAGGVLMAAAVIIASARGRMKTAWTGAVFLAALAVSSFVFIPGQTVAGDYVMLNFFAEMNGDIFNSILSGRLSEADFADNYDNFNIAPLGNGKYMVLFYYGADGYWNIDSVRIGERTAGGRIVIGADTASGNKVTIIPGGDKISVKGNLRPVDVAYEYEKTGPYAYDMQLRYIILLSFAAPFVILLITKARRRRRLSLDPVIPEGNYVVADIIYMNGEMEYMRDYAYKSLKGTSVVISRDSFEVDGKCMGGCECERGFADKNTALLNAIRLKRGVCVKPAGNIQTSCENTDAEYRMIFDKKRRALVLAAEGRPVAAFRLKPVNTQA